MSQKFEAGDVVRIADEFPPFMSHFDGRGCEAVVVGSYADQYGGSHEDDEDTSYTLNIRGHGRISWYQESMLTLIREGGTTRQTKGLLKEWGSNARVNTND